MGGGSTKQKPQGTAGLRKEEYQMLRRCLDSLPFPPGTMNAGIIAGAAQLIERVEYKDPINILSKGDRAKGIFILVKGQVHVLSASGDIVADVRPGDFFGEISTLFYVPVTATVQSTTRAQVLLLKEETLRRSIGEVVSTDPAEYFVRRRYFDTSGMLNQSDLMHRISVSTLSRIPLFSEWTSPAIDSLVKQCREDSGLPYPVLLIPDKSMLIMEEDKSEVLVIITRGRVDFKREKECIASVDSRRWPVWIGEEGLFVNADNLCAVCADGTCQSIRVQKSTIQKIINMYEEEVGQSFQKHARVWQTRLSDHHSLPDVMKAELLLPVLINTVSKLEMFSSATLSYVYDVAMLAKVKTYADKAVIVDGSGNPVKIKKALQASQSKVSQGQTNGTRGPMVSTVQGGEASTVIAENDLFLLPLRGEIAVDAVENFSFKEKTILYLPHAQLHEIKLTAKGETLVLTVEGSRILDLCNAHPDAQLHIPRPVL